MKQKELNEIRRLHAMWLRDEDGGKRANLSGADLREADLSGANLYGANLRYADLSGADLREADLRYADLREADLREADLRYAILCNADLSRANLREADLRYAILYGADLRGANLCEADLRGANLCGADLRGANLDFSCLPLWCGAKFKADDRICKQLVAHALMILQRSGCGNEKLLSEMEAYKKGWHWENEF